MKRLKELTDPDALAYVADAFGMPMAAVYVDDLADWCWVLERAEYFFANASQPTRDDYARFITERYGPCGTPSLGDLHWVLSSMRWRIRALVDGAPR
ncbi:MAG TPA: hypothetical protein VEJ21_05455 [Acidimicrobiales bacterium]|nr:hypothetical protein [Acidimicrobiales bacterium]